MKRHRLAPNFLTGEFFGKGNRSGKFVKATSLRVAQRMQEVRDELRAPVTITGSRMIGGPGEYEYVINYSCPSKGIEGKESFSWEKSDFRVYGLNGCVADRILGIMRHDFGSFLDSVDKGIIGMNNAVALVAMLQVDYKEGKNNSTVFGMEMGLNNTPWCALFYHWCVNQVRSVLTVDLGYDYKFTSRYSNSRKTIGLAPLTVKSIADIKPGYAMVWARTDDPVAGHTGVCIHNDPERERITLIEPNYGNKVTLREKSYNRLNRNKLEFIGACSYFPEDIHVGDFMAKVNLAQGTYIASSSENDSTR